MTEERLDKLLTASGLYSRSGARAAIAGGRVTVDGAAALRPEQKVPRSAAIVADGRAVDTAEFVYYMMNKPAGCVSAVTDKRLPTVVELLPPELRARGLFPVGRLDADVTGLLLLTDDGGYAHRVTAPRAEVPKRYEAFLDGPVGEREAAALAAGVSLRDGTRYRPARLEWDGADGAHAFVTVTEGKFHEVKNLFAVCGRQVLRLRRVAVGGLTLDEALPEGGFRRLMPEEALLPLGPGAQPSVPDGR